MANFKELIKRYKWFAAVGAVILFAIIFLFGAKLVLLVNVMLGNDVIIKLEYTPHYINLTHGESATANFQIDVTTNPFCKAICNYEFRDISQDRILDNNISEIKPGFPFKKEYTITPLELGEGKYLYRFDIKCHSASSFLCHTTGDTMTRSALLVLSYGLNGSETELKEILEGQLISDGARINELSSESEQYKIAALELERYATSSYNENDFIYLNENIKDIVLKFNQLNELRMTQDYYALNQERIKFIEEIERSENSLDVIKEKTNSSLLRFNSLVGAVLEMKIRAGEMRLAESENLTLKQEINSAISHINDMNDRIVVRESLDKKEKYLSSYINETNDSLNKIDAALKDEELSKQEEYLIHNNVLNSLAGVPEISVTLGMSNYSLEFQCERIKAYNARVLEANASFKEKYAAQNYTLDKTFWSNVSAKIHNFLLTETIKLNIQVNDSFIITDNYPGYDLTPAMIAELSAYPLAQCSFVNVSMMEINGTNIPEIILNKNISSDLIELSLEQPKEMCCVFGKCNPCCVNDSCSKENYPVVLIHGHAIYQKSSADFSLDTFEQIQNKLEEDGYLNAGGVTLASAMDIPNGILGEFDTNMSFRASYYFDTFKYPDSYVTVQTKSESIDNYAIKLKELIEIVKYRTGKDKVDLVSFSMGGLVARRYVQIFGDGSVNQVVTIGTPNHGIEGRVAQFCSVIGNSLECKDMQWDSLFINRLNNGAKPTVPVTVILGTGCSMDSGKSGDGVVTEDSAKLEFATNYVINGSCRSATDPLHLDLLYLDRYPQTYEFLLRTLSKN